MNINFTDGGRQEAGIDEANDCVVRALATVFELPYAEAHATCAQFGRMPKRGMNATQIKEMFKHMETRGYIIREVNVPQTHTHFGGQRRRRAGGESVQTFLGRMSSHSGRLFVCSTQHAFAVINHEVYDKAMRIQNRAKMHCAWEVVLPKKFDLSRDDIAAMMARLDALEKRLA